jgi:MFS family permease
MTPQFRWYLGGLAAWFTSFGIQTIVFPWLVAVVLGAPAQRVGIAQMVMMAPAIVFMLLGGAVADRADCRRLLLRYHLLAALPPLALAAVVASGSLGYVALLGYALVMGTLGAFVVPARDALLTRVVRQGRERAIAVSSAGQFICQLVGIVVAGWAGRIGAVALLAGQAVILAAGALTLSRLAPAPPAAAHRHDESRLAAMRDGLRAVARSERIFPVIVAMLAVGVFYGGAFAVILPLIVRDIYGGGSGELALVNTCFWGGTLASTMLQIRLGALRRPGRAVLLALTAGAVVLSAMSVPTPLWGFALICLVWGVGAGVTLTQGRTIVQLEAPESHRARALAIFQLGFAGGAPVGALGMGYLAALTGPRSAAIYPAVAMMVVLGFLFLRSGLWRHAAGPSASGAAPLGPRRRRSRRRAP